MTHYNHCKNCWKQAPCSCALDKNHLCEDCAEIEALNKKRVAKCEKELQEKWRVSPQVWLEPISVWPFGQAPRELQAFSNNGGDEDWIALIPPKVMKDYGDYIGWLEGTSFDSCGQPQVYELSNGYRIVIGSHA